MRSKKSDPFDTLRKSGDPIEPSPRPPRLRVSPFLFSFAQLDGPGNQKSKCHAEAQSRRETNQNGQSELVPCQRIDVGPGRRIGSQSDPTETFTPQALTPPSISAALGVSACTFELFVSLRLCVSACQSFSLWFLQHARHNDRACNGRRLTVNLMAQTPG
jgi:hypothetical protein